MARRAHARPTPSGIHRHRQIGFDILSEHINPAVVTMRFVASDSAAVSAILSRYVVGTRRSDGCINVDYCLSTSDPEVFVIISKWQSSTTQRAHFDEPLTIQMAQSLTGLLRSAPEIELLDPISVHDQR